MYYRSRYGAYFGSRPASTAQKKRKTMDTKMIPAADVWAAACAALRINGEYLKEIKNEYGEDYEVVSSKPANKVLMRSMLMGQAQELITDADRVRGEVVRQYWQTKLMDVLSDRANDFVKNAVELASRAEFASDDWLGLATAAFLPEGYDRGQVRDERRYAKQEAQMCSEHFGAVGDRISGELKVMESRWSEKWGTHYVTAMFGHNMVLFAYRSSLEAGHESRFTGTIKAHRDGNVTQLNRVRLG